MLTPRVCSKRVLDGLQSAGLGIIWFRHCSALLCNIRGTGGRGFQEEPRWLFFVERSENESETSSIDYKGFCMLVLCLTVVEIATTSSILAMLGEESVPIMKHVTITDIRWHTPILRDTF